MSTYKKIILISFALMLMSGFLNGVEQNIISWISNFMGWFGAFLFGYAAPRYKPQYWWFFAGGAAAIAGFWAVGACVFWLIS